MADTSPASPPTAEIGKPPVHPQQDAGECLYYMVPGAVPFIQQKSDSVCWATVAAMMWSWRAKQPTSVEDCVATAGDKYVQLYAKNEGIGTKDTDFYSQLGMTGESTLQCEAHAIHDALKAHGPLLVMTAEGWEGAGYVHMKILRGIDGDGTDAKTMLTVMDPMDGPGTESVADFKSKFETAASQFDITWQVVHF